MQRPDRGTHNCQAGGCDKPPVLSVLVQVLTFGGRKDRRKATSGVVRLCKTCVGKLQAGKMPVELQHGIQRAVEKVREVA